MGEKKLSMILFDLIDEITNEEVRTIVRDVLAVAPDYFWTAPAAAKHHCEDERDKFGLLLHTIRCVKVLKWFATTRQMNNEDVEVCQAALLLHDCCKNDIGDNVKPYTVPNHPAIAAGLIRKTCPDNPVAELIASLVETHYGCFSVGAKPETQLQQLIFEADFIASREDIKIGVNYLKED